ncbi:MAG: IclR family transcriptional regulator [Spirochaetaceae bacterium]|nr:MAG: IclR family transcriptional regulator [Spirochaetaceae bacterium]
MAKAPATTKRNQSIAKALHIIEAMAASEGPMRLQDIGKTVRLPASTVLRFLKTLMDHDYVEQNPDTLQYFLTLKLCAVADQVKRQVKIRDVVHPHLLSLSRKLGEATSLAVERDMLVVYIDVVEGPDHMLQTLQRIGKIAPMNTTGVGKALLLDATADEVDALIKSRGLPKPTSRTISTKKSLVAELKAIRDRGYAIDDEECEMGVRCVAVPLRDYSGKVVAAMSTSGPIARMTPDRIEKIGKQFIAAAATVSRQLGYTD